MTTGTAAATAQDAGTTETFAGEGNPVRGGEYYIHVEHHYYEGTFNTPPDGPAQIWFPQERVIRPVTFATRRDAETWLRKREAGIPVYRLSHGEHSAPTYRVRKFRKTAERHEGISRERAGSPWLKMVPAGYAAQLRLDGRIAGDRLTGEVPMPEIPYGQRWGRAVVSLEFTEDTDGHTRKTWVEARRMDGGVSTQVRWRTGQERPLGDWYIVR